MTAEVQPGISTWSLLFTITSLLIVAGCDGSRNIQAGILQPGSQVCSESTCFLVEIADTIPERQRGLMHMETLDKDKGMLFIFDEPGMHMFWMKNTLIPLDIVWLDVNGRVIYISEDTPPCEADPCPSYGPQANAKYVLEINAWSASETGIDQGDTLTIDISQ